MKNYKDNILAIILSIILVIFIWHKFLVSGNSIIFVMIFLCSYYFIKKAIQNSDKRKFITSFILAILFASIEVVCNSINTDYTLNNICSKWLIINFMGYLILIWSIISNTYTVLDKQELKLQIIKIGKIDFLSDSNLSFCISLVLILLAWVPYFLTYYPGLLTADSCAQVAQAIGIAELSNHHPVFHTAIISLFINIGRNISNNINVGVALYTLFQMVMMSIMFAVVLKYLSKRGVPLLIKCIVLLYYMFYPVNALFSIIMWKDILFSGIVPIFIIGCIELIFNTEEILSKKRSIILYILISALMCFLRNNGVYILILTIPFIIIVLRKHWKKVLLIFISTVGLYIATKAIIFNVLSIKNGAVGEMLSIPLQQIARVEKYHKEELDNETIEEINKFFICTNIGDKYNPILSDPVKAQFNNDYFIKNKSEFLKLWNKLIKSYFKDYVESFISNSYGYYYPEASHWVANRTMENNSLGINLTPIIQGTYVSKYNSLIERRDIPLISMCFSIGMAFWIIVVSLGYKIFKKDYKYMVIYLPIFILWLTIVASPVFCEYRYAYPIFTTLPLYISLNFKKESKKNEKSSSINTML